jgi:pyruvate ferredoxin oxidoreductase gamma subunit
MLRVRFHGRGGHGIKTASRILGTAAFQRGWQAQDAPLYGAERRGAAVTASTRMDNQPILERGVIANPDIIVVADETLLSDPDAAVLRGQTGARGVFVNSPRGAADLAGQYGIVPPVVSLDLTGWAAEGLGQGSALSAALGAVACALAGSTDVEGTAQAVRDELEGLHLSAAAIEKNVELAKRVFLQMVPFPACPSEPVVDDESIYVPRYEGVPRGVPIILAPGNSAQRHTGAWRIFRPSIDLAACTRCSLCVWRCPDGAVGINDQGYPVIDYETCKGCMICAEECPVKCIHEEKEVRAW